MIKQNMTLSSLDREMIFSIRVASGRTQTCAVCDKEFNGGGPVGHRGDDPVCDPCLFEGSPELGMVMALISVTRAFATLVAGAADAWMEPLRELGVFARIYELVAAKSGPNRPFDVPGVSRDETSDKPS